MGHSDWTVGTLRSAEGPYDTICLRSSAFVKNTEHTLISTTI